MKRVICLILSIILICQGFVFANDEISLYINGNLVQLDAPIEVINDMPMLPAKEVIERMGFFVKYGEYDRRSVIKEGYLAKINGADAIIPLDSNEICYDEVWIELSNPTKSVENDVLVPLESISCFYGVDIINKENRIDIKAVKEDRMSLEGASNDTIEALIATLGEGMIVSDHEDLENSEVFTGTGTGFLEKRIVDVEDGIGFTQAIELETLKQGSADYSAQVKAATKAGINKDDFVVLSFWAKSIITADESGFSQVKPIVEESAKGTFVTALNPDQSTQLSGKWKKFYYPFKGLDDWPSGTCTANIRVGYKPQTIQIADFKVVNYGNVDVGEVSSSRQTATTYYGREEDALWRKEALKRIEKYRVRDITVIAVDEKGNPVPNVKVDADMTQSEFLWGSIGPVHGASTVTPAFTEYMKKWFNTFTTENHMKMKAYDDGSVAVDQINFTIENGLNFHGHAFWWDGLSRMPDDLSAVADTISEEEARRIIYEYISELTSFFGDAIVEMDVLNEPRANKFFRERFGVDFIADLFRLSDVMRADYNPDMRLQLNETGINGSMQSWDYIYNLDILTKELLKEGAVIDSLGHQVHTYPIYYPQSLYNQMDYSSDLVDALEITEYDCVLAASGLTAEERAKLEADYFRDMLIMGYSHPKMVGFIMWGFFDSGHWRADSPMLSWQYNDKEGVKHWEDLVLGEWKTKTGGVTDEEGKCVMRGHRGDYNITVSVNGKTVSDTLKVTDTGENTVTVIVSNDKITTQSSQNVVKEKVELKNWTELNTNRGKYINAYKKYLTNRVLSVKDSEDNSINCVLDEESGTNWMSKGKQDFLTVELDNLYHGGTLNIKWKEDLKIYLYDIEISEDGKEWESFERSDGSMSTQIRFSNKKVKYIRIKSLTDRSIVIDDISFVMI